MIAAGTATIRLFAPLMRWRVVSCAIWAVSSLFLVAAPVSARDGKPVPSLKLSNCELSLPGTGLTAPAECGWLEVAEDPDQPEGRKIKLRVARVPAQDRRVEPDPLVLFAGGPGQAASEAWLMLAPALRKVNKNRDILLVDQRGTGQSHPLRCPQMELAESLTVEMDQLESTTRACLAAQDADPRFYTTTIAMQDYDQVRSALGYEQVNLLGVSYGTRAAQVYLRMFPDRVRTVVLDSVAPQTLPLGTEHAQKLDAALAQVLAACEADADCAAAFPNVTEDLDTIIRQLDAAPVSVTVDHPLTGEPFTMEFDREALAGAIRFLTYSAETQAMLPLLIHEAATTNDFRRLASQMLITASGLSDSIAQGMEMSVVCAEDFPLFPPAAETPAEATTRAGFETNRLSLMDDSMIQATRIQCGVWPQGAVPPDFHEPVVSDKPVLLLSGELDPVTPPEYADAVQAHLSNSLHLVARGQGHSVTGRGCIGQLVSEFIVAGKLDGLDTTCIDHLKPSPWFMTLTGPEP